MADISQVKLPNNTIYNIKDAAAQAELAKIIEKVENLEINFCEKIDITSINELTQPGNWRVSNQIKGLPFTPLVTPDGYSNETGLAVINIPVLYTTYRNQNVEIPCIFQFLLSIDRQITNDIYFRNWYHNLATANVWSEWKKISTDFCITDDEANEILNELFYDDLNSDGILTYKPHNNNNNNDGYLVTGYTKESKNYIIPNSKLGLPIIAIESGAFNGCVMMESITIPKSILNIGTGAFDGCTNLKYVNSLGSINYIYDNMFKDHTNLVSVVIPDTVKHIGNFAFYNCNNLSTTIPSSVEIINTYAFFRCNIKSVNVPYATSIGRFAFAECKNLESIILPISSATSTSIDTYALFDNCTKLKSVNFPTGITSIGGYACRSCSSLNYISIPDTVTSIDICAFENCSSLLEITIPKSIKSIATNAIPKTTTIKGYTGSYAQTFASSNGYTFVSIG